MAKHGGIVHYRVMTSTVRRAGVREEKLVLREAIVAARDSMSEEARARASEAIAAGIVALAAFAQARVVLAFLPYRSEWNATLVVDAAIAAGKLIAAPRVDVPARMLRALRVESLERDVAPGHRGIPEPHATRAEVALASVDCVLVPGVAFDAEGARLGYGGGYYDRTLEKLSRKPRLVGIAYAAQELDAIPREPHDVPLDVIVTEQGARTFEPAAA
jgi:5-formyltetrahydrofolate cyclo-ligase